MIFTLGGRPCVPSDELIHLGDEEFAKKKVAELSGTGVPIMAGKNWTNREWVSSRNFIGVYVDETTGEETRTRNATIHYSKTGTHIIPARRD